jgi:hypothetical protein
MKEVKELLLNYEKWFGDKLVRNYEKKNNKWKINKYVIIN